MAYLLADILAGAQSLADKINDASVSPDEWTLWTKQGVEELHNFVANAYQDTFFEQADFSLANGVYAFDLTTLPGLGKRSFRRIKALDLYPDTINRMAVPKMSFDERDVFAGIWPLPPSSFVGVSPSTPYHPVLRRRVMGMSLILQPQEIAGGKPYRLYYIPAPTLPVNSSDVTWTIDAALERWVEYVMHAVARKGLLKEESDTSGIDARLSQMRSDITDDARLDELPDRTVDAGW